MTRLIPFTPGEYYHIYNRGANKAEIFLDDWDYKRFQNSLFCLNSKQTLKYSDQDPYRVWEIDRGETLVDIGAYCLMPNHFHLLIKSKNEKNTALFLQRVLLSHSKFFNKKYDRTGTLFQGKSKAEHVVGDRYLKYLYIYNHLNPVKLIQSNWKEDGIKNTKETIEYLKEYKYSSFTDYLEMKRPEVKILNKEPFPNYFQTPKIFENEISEFLNYEKE